MDSCTFCRVSLLPDFANFTSITLHVRVALKWQYMFLIRAKPSPATQNVKDEFFHCIFQISLIFFCVAVLLWISHSIKFNNNFIFLTPMKSRTTDPLKGISVLETHLRILHFNCCHARMICSYVRSSLIGCLCGIGSRGLNTFSMYGDSRFWKKKSEWIGT